MGREMRNLQAAGGEEGHMWGCSSRGFLARREDDRGGVCSSHAWFLRQSACNRLFAGRGGKGAGVCTVSMHGSHRMLWE